MSRFHTARFWASVIRLQCMISSSVRLQPVQWSRVASSAHWLRQGLGTVSLT